MLSNRKFIGAALLVTGGLITANAFAQVLPPCAPYRQTQNVNLDDVVDGASIACSGGLGNSDNRYCRSYDLSACSAAGNSILVSCVSFAVEFNTVGGYFIEVNIYEDTDGGAPVEPGVDLLLLGTMTVEIPMIDFSTPEAATHFQANFELGPGVVEVPADSMMVVEIFLPDRTAGDLGSMRPGVNNSGEDADSYFMAPDCGIPTYETVGFLGLPGAMLLQTVDATIVEPLLPCVADCGDGNGSVDISDLLSLLGGWGQPAQSCDITGIDDTIDINDLLALLTAWGPCATRPPFCGGDTNADNAVDISDLLNLLSDWGVVTCSTADFDTSGAVNITDLLQLLSGWGPCPE